MAVEWGAERVDRKVCLAAGDVRNWKTPPPVAVYPQIFSCLPYRAGPPLLQSLGTAAGAGPAYIFAPSYNVSNDLVHLQYRAFVLELCVLLLAHRMRQSARKTFCANAQRLS